MQTIWSIINSLGARPSTYCWTVRVPHPLSVWQPEWSSTKIMSPQNHSDFNIAESLLNTYMDMLSRIFNTFTANFQQ